MPLRRQSRLLTLPEDGGLHAAQVAMLMSMSALAGIALASLAS